jgi:hypothetical protein
VKIERKSHIKILHQVGLLSISNLDQDQAEFWVNLAFGVE